MASVFSYTLVLEPRRSVTDKNCIWIHTFVGFPVKPGKDGNIRTFNLGRISALSAVYESREEKQCHAVPRQSDVWNVPLPRCYAGCRLFANGTMKKRTHHYPSVAFLVIRAFGDSVRRYLGLLFSASTAHSKLWKRESWVRNKDFST